ncbi:MAG: ATP-dependent helicase/nuclease subunit B [Glaciecola sp.]|jgi:ATP-dependent helicase/nuclease subunit B
MSITLHATSYGADATRLLVQRVVAAKATSPLMPVTVVVPSNFVGISARRTLARAQPGGVIGLSILTIYRLAELLGAGALAAQGRRPVSAPIIGATIRQVLAQEPGIFHRVHDHPATETALAQAHRELSELTPAALDTLAGSSTRSADVVRVHRATRELLHDAWYDEADLMAAATQNCATSSVLGDLGTIVLHLPQRLSPATASLLLALAQRTEVEVIAALTGHLAADAEVTRALSRLGLVAPGVTPQALAATSIVTVSDADEEARTAVASIIEAARDGVALERMAVLYPSAQPYARIVAHHLDAAELPWNGSAVRPLADRVAGRWLLDLLALASSRWSRPQVLGLFTSAPRLDVPGHVEKVAHWERLSREAGIVDGRDAWDARLARLAANARRPADAQHAQDLREAVAAVAADLDRGAAQRTWAGLATWAASMVTRHLGGEQDRQAWPSAEQVAAQKLEDALERLADLDMIEPSADLATFTRALARELHDGIGREGRFGEGVLVGTLAAGLGLELDLVVILGMAEGILPARPREDSLLADADRSRVADQLPARATRVGAEHRSFLAAIASSSERRVLVAPRGDLRRSVERAPSRWLRDAVEEVTGQRDLSASNALVAHIPSHAGRIATTSFANDENERLLSATGRSLAGARLTPAAATDLDAVLGQGVTLLAGRGRERFTRFNGNLDAVAAEVAACHDAPERLSASAVESFLSCPHGYLVGRLLGVNEVRNPEEALTISPMDRGNLIHTILEVWLSEQIQSGAVPSSSTPWPAPARERLVELATEHLDAIAAEGIVGHPVLWRQETRVLLAEFEAFLVKDDQLRHRRGCTPIEVEAGFGLRDRPHLVVDLGDGRSMRFGGMIDRIDRTNAGGLVVTDYKTGSPRDFRRLAQQDPSGGGTKVQLMLYALAARQILDEPDTAVHAQYWFTSTKGDWLEVGYDVDDDVEAHLCHLLRTVEDQLRAGRFPQHPHVQAWGSYVTCRHCDPDGLGTAARQREFERLVRAPELADYLRLVAPQWLDEVTP